MQDRHAGLVLAGIIAGVVAGMIAGWVFGPAVLAFAWLGTLFLNALKMIIVPLVFVAVVSGVSSLGDVRRLGRVGGITVLYYMTTTAIAVLIGLLVVNLLQPGVGLDISGGVIPDRVMGKEDTGVSDILLMIVSPNLFDAAVKTQLLPIIFFSVLFGAALTTVGQRGEHVIGFFNGINEALMKLIMWIMYFAPIGVFALVAKGFGEAGSGAEFMARLQGIGWYMATVLAGLAIHFIVLVLILRIVARRGLEYLAGMLRAVVTAFGTASSSATLPITMECARENDIDERAVRFVLPLGATINMDGTALYEAAAVMFIAQAYGLDMSLGQQSIIFLTATLAAIGAAGVPEAGLVTMVIVLSAVGLPLEGIGLILSIDWLLDRFRTAVNVWGDAVGAAVMHRFIPQV